MSRSKAKGTAAETAVCDYLRPLFPYVERRALRGTGDLADIAGIPGAVIEVKNCREWRLSEWLRATVAKALPSRSLPFVVIKAPGKGTARVGEWFAVTDVATMARLLADQCDCKAAS